MGKTHSTLGEGATSLDTESPHQSRYFNVGILCGESPTTKTQLKRQERFGKALPSLRCGLLPNQEKETLRTVFTELRDESTAVYEERNYLYAAQLYSLGLMVAHHLRDSLDCQEISYMLTARADCLQKMEETEAVIADCDEALSMDPDNIRAYCLKTRAIKSQKKYQEALDLAKQGLARAKSESNENEILCALVKDLNGHLKCLSTGSDGLQQIPIATSDKVYKQRLKANRTILLTSMSHVDEIVDMLQERQLFSEMMVDNINAKAQTRLDKVRMIIDVIPTRGPHAYLVLVKMLQLTRQLDLFHKLNIEGVDLPNIKLQRPYLKKLCKYNEDKIKHTKQDLRMRTSDYIQLHMYSGQNKPCLAERRGIKEVNLHEKNITKVDLESIFKLPSEGSENYEEPRLVLMLGSPGSGKTHTCLHIVDSAVKGLWQYPDTTPFFFRMKDIHNYETSLKDFLLDRCGPPCVKDEVWQTLQDDDQFFFIIDGLDECPLDFLSEQQTIQNPEEKAGIGIILNSLIRGTLLPYAKILLTSRVYSTEKAISAAGSIVELGGIPSAKLWEMFQGELSEVEYKLAREMLQHDDMLSLAKLPVNAFGLVDYFKYMDPGNVETQTELLFSITMAKMVKCCRNRKMNDITTLQQAVGQQAQVLREIAGLSVVSIENTTITMTFTREELHKRGVTDAAIECGLFAGYISSLKHLFGEKNEERFHIPHLATLELLAGLGNTQKDIESLLCLVRRNNGQLDMVIMFTAGMMGNPRLWPVLLQVFPETMTDTYADKAKKMMTAVLTSSRKHTLGGELFVIYTIAESQQWQLAPDVQRSLTGMSIDTSIAADRPPSRKVIEVTGTQSEELPGTTHKKNTPTEPRKRNAFSMVVTKQKKVVGLSERMPYSYAPRMTQPTETQNDELPGTSGTRNTSALPQTKETSSPRAVDFSQHMSSASAPPPTQLCGSLVLIRPLLNAGDSIALGKLLTHTATPYSQVKVAGDIGIHGLSRLAASAPCVTVNGTRISSTDLQQSHDQLTGLHGLGLLHAGIYRYTLPAIAPALAELPSLEAVDLSANPLGLGSEGNIQQTAATSSLGAISHLHRYLRLSGCDLTNTDISALLSVSTRPASLLHLDITNNKLSGVDELAAYMARSDTVLQGLVMHSCGVGETCKPLIQALQANNTIRCLDMCFNEGIRAGVCEMVGGLLSSPVTVLNELHVVSCDLDVSALLYPLTLPTASPHVTSLDLTDNNTARHAIAQLCQIMTCTRATSPLLYLGLDECGLQDNHLDQLTRALSDVSSKLTTLNVSYNKDLTISSINNMINNTRLDQLWFADCRLSTVDYVQLFTAISRPDCSIKRLATGEAQAQVDLQSGLQQLSRKLHKLVLFCDESQREALGECVGRVEERLQAPGMIICCSNKYSWNLYKAESGAYYRHLPPHARAMMTSHPGWQAW